MMSVRYRARVAGGFTYPPTGRVYAEGEVDSLSDWHKDDIKAALHSGLIEEQDAPAAPDNDQPTPAAGTPEKTKESK